MKSRILSVSFLIVKSIQKSIPIVPCAGVSKDTVKGQLVTTMGGSGFLKLTTGSELNDGDDNAGDDDDPPVTVNDEPPPGDRNDGVDAIELSVAEELLRLDESISLAFR